jgi:hypothetical protein
LKISPGAIDIDDKDNLCQLPASTAPSASVLPRSFPEILYKEYLASPQSLSGKVIGGDEIDFFFSHFGLDAINDPNEISFSVRTVLPGQSSVHLAYSRCDLDLDLDVDVLCCIRRGR